MALIASAIYDTQENGRDQYTERFLFNILRPRTQEHTDPKHTFVFVVNAATPRTLDNLADFASKHRYPVQVITMPENVGTALAINQAWKLRAPGENAVKMDNDVEIHAIDWIERMEDALQREPKIGLLGLKRKDLWQHPGHPDPFYASTLHFIPDGPGDGRPWVIVEKTDDIMGTVQMYSSACLDEIGYLWQPSLYGYDDGIACERVRKAGFETAFLPCIEIDHPDPGGNDYQAWKEEQAKKYSPNFHEAREAVRDGRLPVYVPADYK